MPRRAGPPPLCRHKAKDLAYVTIDGRQAYLGRWGSAEAQSAYDEIVTEWKVSVSESSRALRVGHLMLRYLDRAHADYSPSQAENVRQMLLSIRSPAGGRLERLPITLFGAGEVKQIRAAMLADGLARTTANKRLGLMRQMFKWGVAEGLVTPATLACVAAVPSFRRGREGIREPEPITPVDDQIIDATLPAMSPALRAMVRLQRLTGMRPGEIVRIAPSMITASGRVWTARLRDHKTSHRGRERLIAIGPCGQEVLGPHLAGSHDLEGPIFRSRGGAPWSVDVYRRAIARACDRTWPPPRCLTDEAARRWRSDHRWSPNQIRHTFATQVRRDHGLEAAQVSLGHASADVTQVYAERDLSLMLEVAARIG